jgi:hypothetical protein
VAWADDTGLWARRTGRRRRPGLAPPARAVIDLQTCALGAGADAAGGRGLHSSTFQLSLSAFCGIGGAFRGCLGGVQGVSGGIRGWLRYILYQKRFRLS